MKKLSLMLILFSIMSIQLKAQWNGQTSSSDLVSPIYRTGMIAIDDMNKAQIRLNSNGTYYGKIGNPSAQIWSLGWGTSGTDLNPVFTWRADGQVGIGTTSPAFRLHVSAADVSVQQRFERTGSTTGIADLGVDDQGLKFFVGGYPGNALKVTFGSNGNVGIGTTSPAANLHIANLTGGGIRLGAVNDGGNKSVAVGAQTL